MKKDFFTDKKPKIKVAKLNHSYIENGIVLLVGTLLLTNLVLSFKILFG